jgi:hypothetical protein
MRNEDDEFKKMYFIHRKIVGNCSNVCAVNESERNFDTRVVAGKRRENECMSALGTTTSAIKSALFEPGASHKFSVWALATAAAADES